ncbi:MAG: methylamine utilization protein [Pseudomonadales bacterium]|nr:methylamine utilization protein [Pseudomonadales bacterium]
MTFLSERQALKSVLWAFTLCIMSINGWASAVATSSLKSIKFVDQDNRPISDVVILGVQTSLSAPSQQFVMDQINKSFHPHVLVVPTGSLVEFPNSDDIRHHVYSFSKTKPFELKLYAGKPEAPINFDTPGIVVLGCNIHDTMVGYIVVRDSPEWAQSNSQGIASLSRFVDLNQAVRIWHPQQENAQQFLVTKLPSVESGNQNGEAIFQLTLKAKESQDSKFRKSRFKRYGS